MSESTSEPTLNKLLEDLAIELPKQLLKRIKNGEGTAADMAVARQLLKDNGIMSLPESNPELSGLADKLGDLDLPPVLPFKDGTSG